MTTDQEGVEHLRLLLGVADLLTGSDLMSQVTVFRDQDGPRGDEVIRFNVHKGNLTTASFYPPLSSEK